MEEIIGNLFNEMKERVLSIFMKHRSGHRCDLNCNQCQKHSVTSVTSGSSSQDFSECETSEADMRTQPLTINAKEGNATSVDANDSMESEVNETVDSVKMDSVKVDSVKMESINEPMESVNEAVDAEVDDRMDSEAINETAVDSEELSTSEDQNSIRTRRSSTMAQRVMHKCHHCSQSFKSVADLNVHAARHSRLRPFKCVGCDKAFMEKRHLKDHERRYCRATTFTCSECDKTFCDREKCKNHIETHANKSAEATEPKRKNPRRDNRVHLCPVCKQRFTSNEGLSVHLMKHSGLNPFKCNRCDKKFTKLSSLKMHAAKAHSSNN